MRREEKKEKKIKITKRFHVGLSRLTHSRDERAIATVFDRAIEDFRVLCKFRSKTHCKHKNDNGDDGSGQCRATVVTVS